MVEERTVLSECTSENQLPNPYGKSRVYRNGSFDILRYFDYDVTTKTVHTYGDYISELEVNLMNSR